MRSLVGVFAQVVALTSLVAGQRGTPIPPRSPPTNQVGTRSCVLPEPSCPYETDLLDDMQKLEANVNQIVWSPFANYNPDTQTRKRVTPAGLYTFRFEASNKCVRKEATATVDIRCPPKPTAVVELMNAKDGSYSVLYGQKATFNASKSTAFDPKNKLYYEWWVVSVPTDSSIKVTNSPIPDANSAVYSTPTLDVGGSYQYKVIVSDGCSTSEFPVCFVVECNCAPTANAGASSTVWTNTPTVFNSGSTSTGGNQIQGKSYILDGSLSFDFDSNDVLSYEWNFVSWRSLDPALSWTRSTNTLPTQLTYGYLTNCKDSGGGGVDRVQGCTFTRVGRLGQNDREDSGQRTSLEKNSTTPKSSAIGYPKRVPLYNASSEVGKVVGDEVYRGDGTWYQANITKVSYVNTLTQRIEYNSTSCVTSSEKNFDYCTIQIRQKPAAHKNDPGVLMAKYNPRAELTLGPSFKACRGLWKFELTVKDICGTVTQSKDEITVTVRCNEPPVAIACCNNTQVWQGSNFEQVRLDGRSSHDGDQANQDKRPGFRGSAVETLTYKWTFESQPAGHCPRAHAACEEQYCTNPNYFTNRANGQMMFGGFNTDCSPTIYPIVYDINSPLGNIPGCNNPRNNPGGGNVCDYKAVDPTQNHVGNSAFFRPSIRGNYIVKLEVDDGCNTATDTVIITAVCPTLVASISLSANSGIKNGLQQATVDVTGTVDAYAGNAALLTYQWSAVDKATNKAAGTWTNAANPKTTVGFDSAGTFVLTFGVSDKCQTATVTKEYVVRCNSAPSLPGLTVTNPTLSAGQVLFSGNSFPNVIVEARSTDTDPLTYSFTVVNSDNKAIQINNPAGDSVQFMPENLVRRDQFDFNVNTALGSYSVNPALYTISATATDGCTTSSRGSTTVRVACQGSLAVILSAGQTVNYDHGARSFPLVKVDGSASTFAGGTQKDYRWEIAYTSNAPNSTPRRVAQSAGSGWTQSTLSFRPTEVGAYRVALTITDGCSFASRATLIQASCSIAATSRARALISGAPIASNTVVSWNSFLTSQTAGFPTITLDGTASTGAANDQLFYEWSYASGTPSQGLSSTTQGLVSYTLPGEGTHTISLAVRNGVCPQDTTTVTITSRCMTLNAMLRNFPGVSTGKTAQINVDFDGTKFQRAVLDGLATTYTDSNTGATGNFERLSYKWNIIKSPLNSFYEAYILKNTIRTPPATTNQDPVQIDRNETNIAEGVVRTCTKNIMTSLVSTSTTYVETEVILANKHYNKPHTCFIPDRPGTYEVRLTVTDGCTSSEATATVVARCNEAPRVSNAGFTNTVYQLNTSTVTRVFLPATVTPGRNAQAASLTYQWSVISAPGESKHKPGVPCTLTNDKSSTASVVVDVSGSYAFMLSVSDGCNAAVNTTFSFSATCSEDITLQQVTVTGADGTVTTGVNWTSPSTPLSFTLKSGASSFCGNPTFRWTLTSRTCNVPYTAPRPPPPASAQCELPYKCSWEVTDKPCELKTTNPKYIQHTLLYRDEIETDEYFKKDPQKCRAKFLCNHAGTYTLQLTVQDTCGISRDNMQVVCKCGENIQAQLLSVPGRSMFACDAQSKRYMYNQVMMNATARLGRPGPNNAVHACPVKAAPSICTDAVKKQCCAPRKCCGDAHMYQCPQCAQCPQCPQCHQERAIPCRAVSPGRGQAVRCEMPDGTVVDYATGYVGAGSRQTRRRSSLSHAFTATTQSEDSSRSWLMFSIAPMGALIVLSVVGNLWMMSSLSTKSQRATARSGSAMDVF